MYVINKATKEIHIIDSNNCLLCNNNINVLLDSNFGYYYNLIDQDNKCLHCFPVEALKQALLNSKIT